MNRPYLDGAAVTTSDTTTIQTTRALYVGGTGNLKVTLEGGATVTLYAVPAGAMLDLAVDKIFATGTSATSIVALY